MTNKLHNSTNQKVQCPQCKADQDADITTVINRDSSQLKVLFAGKLNQVTCTSCQSKFLVDSPIMYRDDENNYFIYFIPFEDNKNWQIAEKQMQAIIKTIKVQSQVNTLPECRLTLTQKRFIEKIAIHHHNLDDRIIEFIKYQLYNNSNEEQQIDPERYELLFDFSKHDEKDLPFVAFDQQTGKVTSAAHVPFEIYCELDSNFGGSENYKKEMKEIFPGCFVSVDRLIDA